MRRTTKSHAMLRKLGVRIFGEKNFEQTGSDTFALQDDGREDVENILKPFAVVSEPNNVLSKRSSSKIQNHALANQIHQRHVETKSKDTQNKTHPHPHPRERDFLHCIFPKFGHKRIHIGIPGPRAPTSVPRSPPAFKINTISILKKNSKKTTHIASATIPKSA